MNKKVVFVDLKDIVTIPSKSERPSDITDFQLNYEFVKSLLGSDYIVRVNLLCYDEKQLMYANDEDFTKMVSCISYSLSILANKAVVPFISGKSTEDALLSATMHTKKAEIFSDEACWVMVGGLELSEEYCVDYISMEDFCNGGVREDITGTQGGEESQAD